MLTGMDLMACQNLAVPAVVMRHIVDVESGFNPFAIGVVGAHLQRQPQSLDEALATVRMLEDKGYNFSVGLGQVNRTNLGKFGLDSYEKAFSVCPNIVVAARILSECYVRSGGDWGKSFSCYYSGDFVTGYRDGYVQKVFASIGQDVGGSSKSTDADVIPIQMVDTSVPTRANGKAVVPIKAPDSAAYRISIRTVHLDSAAALMTGNASPSPAVDPSQAETERLVSAAVLPKPVVQDGPGGGVFVPVVRGPNDESPARPVKASNAQGSNTPLTSTAAAEQADNRHENRDDAFVF